MVLELSAARDVVVSGRYIATNGLGNAISLDLIHYFLLDAAWNIKDLVETLVHEMIVSCIGRYT